MSTNYPRPFRAGPIEPVVEVGQNLLVVDRENYNLYQVAYIEPLSRSAPLIFNAGALIAGKAATVLNTQTILDMQFGQLAQIRMRVIDDINVVVFQPQAVARQGNKNQTANINAFSAIYDPWDSLSEYYIFEDQRIFLQITNPRRYDISQARVGFYGFKYVLYGGAGASTGGHVLPRRSFSSIQEAVDSGEKFTVVPIGGWGR
jgi:hypothetical protein